MATRPASRDLIADAVLCATNEGSMYDAFCATALITRDLPRTQDDTAAKWLQVASQYLPIYYRTTSERLNGAERLALAGELAVYYGEHLAEFSESQIADLMVRELTPAN